MVQYLGLVRKTEGAIPLFTGTRPSLINSIKQGLLLDRLAKDPVYYVTRSLVSLLSMDEHPLPSPVRQQRVVHSEILWNADTSITLSFSFSLRGTQPTEHNSIHASFFCRVYEPFVVLASRSVEDGSSGSFLSVPETPLSLPVSVYLTTKREYTVPFSSCRSAQ